MKRLWLIMVLFILSWCALRRGELERSSRVRVLFIIAGMPKGGAERQLSLLMQGLDREEFEVGLLIFNSAEKVRYPIDRCEWFRALGYSGSSKLRLFLPICWGINRAVRQWRPDVVYATLNVANHTTRLSKILFRWRAPVITSVRNTLETYSRLNLWAERLLYPWSDRIVVNGAFVKDELIALRSGNYAPGIR